MPHQIFDIHISEKLLDPDTGASITGPFSGRLILHAVLYNKGFDSIGARKRTPANGQAEFAAIQEFSGETSGPSDRSVIAATDVAHVMPG